MEESGRWHDKLVPFFSDLQNFRIDGCSLRSLYVQYKYQEKRSDAL